MSATKLIDIFHGAKRDDTLAIIEGAQALKHALRFHADIQHIVTTNKKQLATLLEQLAPDVISHITHSIIEVDVTTFQRISPKNHRTQVIALAQRKIYTQQDLNTDNPIIFLENPKDLENIGAVIRVAAAANAAAVVSSGEAAIWHPAIIRGGAGLHFALPVLNGSLEQFSQNREVIALDPTGEDIRQATIPRNALFIFGTERYGITKETLAKADQTIRLPMKEGVSSLNLATSVAATLYGSLIIDY